MTTRTKNVLTGVVIYGVGAFIASAPWWWLW